MTTQLLIQAPFVQMGSLSNLWFQLSSTACNLKCRHCYLSCEPVKNTKDFLHIDKVKKALEDTQNEAIKAIYLTGGEPLLHPDFNNIVRLCLKRANVNILTNGLSINDKKARFLRQIENEHENELIFRVSMDYFTEEKNDELRGRGSFRKAMSCIESLLKYDFNPIISITNFWDEDEEYLKQGFAKVFERINFETEELNFKIIPLIKTGSTALNYKKYNDTEIVQNIDMNKLDEKGLDCSNTRVITANGVYCCPALVKDPRGKVGSSIDTASSKTYLETNACYTCINNKHKMFNNNWD